MTYAGSVEFEGREIMFMIDMHVHTDDSPDADIPAGELVVRGMDINLSGVGFVAHVDLDPDDYCYGGFEESTYNRSIELAREKSGERLLILKGIEVGEPHIYGEKVKSIVEYSNYDFITGALHSLAGIGMVLGSEVYADADPLSIVEQYYVETLQIVEEADIDILAHMGLFRRGLALAGLKHDFNELELWPDTIRRILETIIDRNIALELNTSGLRRKENITYPTPFILAQYKKMGGRLITVGSDTHREPYVFFGLKEGKMLLEETGFTETVSFRNRVPRFHAGHNLLN